MSNRQNKSSKAARVLVQTGMRLQGRIIGFTERNGLRDGAVLMFPGKDTAFLPVSKVDGANASEQQGRLGRLLLHDKVQVRVTERFIPDPKNIESKGRRRVTANERVCSILDKVPARLQSQNAVVIKKKDGAGVRVRITSEGPARGLEGFAHFHDIPGGVRALQALQPGSKLVVDLKNPRLDEARDQVVITVDLFAPLVRELLARFPQGCIVSALILEQQPGGYAMSLKSGERAFLADKDLDETKPGSLRIKTSTNVFVAGVDKRGTILVSKRDPIVEAKPEGASLAGLEKSTGLKPSVGDGQNGEVA
jgi:hypothetical protein